MSMKHPPQLRTALIRAARDHLWKPVDPWWELVVAAAAAIPNVWYVRYFDRKYVGEVDDRIAMVYGIPMLVSLGSILVSTQAFWRVVRRRSRPMAARDWLRIGSGVALLFIAFGLFTSGLVINPLVELRRLPPIR
jgi:hypothetical protein